MVYFICHEKTKSVSVSDWEEKNAASGKLHVSKPEIRTPPDTALSRVNRLSLGQIWSNTPGSLYSMLGSVDSAESI